MAERREILGKFGIGPIELCLVGSGIDGQEKIIGLDLLPFGEILPDDDPLGLRFDPGRLVRFDMADVFIEQGDVFDFRLDDRDIRGGSDGSRRF